MTQELSLGALVADASRELAAAGIDDSRLEAELLAAEAFGWSRAQLLARLGEPANGDERRQFERLLERRLRREPLAYTLGFREFYGRRFMVNRDVLIPRPESELLVSGALGVMTPGSLVVDVGTGSGAIGISIAAERTDVRVVELDISPSALRVAASNAVALGVHDRVDFVVADLLSAFRRPSGRPCVFVANLPYVATELAGSLQPEIRDWEPAEALYAGNDGLSVLRRFLEQLRGEQAPGDHALIEMGLGQAEEVIGLALGLMPGIKAEVVKDGTGIDRVLHLYC
ncbi:MAG: peptide chain release factor N(5)-glutamine methyltransferase [Dehalococcoidia bacterium]